MKPIGIIIALALAGCLQPSNPCGVMAAGDTLMPEDSLHSCNGDFELRMQADGNLVLYSGDPVSSNAWWATGTNGLDGYRADMQSDGNFVLYNSYGTQPPDALWSSGTWGLDGAQLELRDSGMLRVTYGGSTVWSFTRGDRNAAGLYY
jgi:hypothetical protein